MGTSRRGVAGLSSGIGGRACDGSAFLDSAADLQSSGAAASGSGGSCGGVCSAFAQLASSGECMRAQVIFAHAFGKKSSCPSVDRARAIMPLSSVMGFIDVLVSDAIHSTLDAQPELHPVECEGARPTSGAADLAWAARMVVEKALDRGSQGALGQGNTKQFYDHILIGECCGRLLDMGLPATVAHAASRHQMLPKMSMRTGPSSADVGICKLGAMTGSRMAGGSSSGICCLRLRLAPARSGSRWAAGRRWLWPLMLITFWFLLGMRRERRPCWIGHGDF